MFAFGGRREELPVATPGCEGARALLLEAAFEIQPSASGVSGFSTKLFCTELGSCSTTSQTPSAGPHGSRSTTPGRLLAGPTGTAPFCPAKLRADANSIRQRPERNLWIK